MTEEKTERRLCQRIANGIRYVENFRWYPLKMGHTSKIFHLQSFEFLQDNKARKIVQIHRIAKKILAFVCNSCYNTK